MATTVSGAQGAVAAYLAKTDPADVDAGFLGYLANLTEVAKVSPVVAKAIVQELADQRANLKLIASENYSSLSTQLAMGNLLTDKHAEGYPGHRFYAGCSRTSSQKVDSSAFRRSPWAPTVRRGLSGARRTFR